MKITKEEYELINQILKVFRERIREILAREKQFNKYFPSVACPSEWLIEKKVVMLLNSEIGKIIEALTWNKGISVKGVKKNA